MRALLSAPSPRPPPQEARHALFAGAEGEDGEDAAELATTVQAPVGAEVLAREDMQRLLDAC